MAKISAEMAEVQSFKIDHKKLEKGIHVSSRILVSDITIRKYDIRLRKPNTEPMETGVVHTLEHLLATEFRKKVLGVIDISPMGCRTGFYLCVISPDGYKDKDVQLQQDILKSIENILDYNTIPGATEEECGNYRDHNLEEAKNEVKSFLNDTK